MPQNNQKGFAAILVLLVVVAAAGVVGYYLYQNNSLGTTPQTPQVSQPKKELTLVLESPNDGTLASDGQITVKGKTLPNTTVAFYTDNDANSVESDATGSFQGSLELANGINTLTVTAFGEDGSEKSTSLDVVYDEQE